MAARRGEQGMIRRAIYCALLRLHPRRFREEYCSEMLWIFDREVKSRMPYRLIWDAVRSLIRQWAVRPNPALAAAETEGAPAFRLLDDSPFGSARFTNGLLTAALLLGPIFSAVIEHGNSPGVLHVPTIFTYRELPPENFDFDRWRLAALDTDGDGWISLQERSREAALRWEPLFRQASADDEGRVALADLADLLPGEPRP